MLNVPLCQMCGMKLLHLSVMFNPQVNAKMKCDLWLKLRVRCHPTIDARP